MYNHQLDTFIVVADVGSFNKAAEKLYISANAVMKQINLLERNIGFPLFERTHTGLKLTASGKSFYKDAKYIIQYSKEAILRASQIKDEHIIRLGVSFTTPVDYIMDLWNQMNDQSLKLELVSFENTPENAKEIMKNFGQKMDIVAGIYSQNLLKERNCLALKLYESSLALAIPRTHPLASKEIINIEDLTNEKILILKKGYLKDIDRLRIDLLSKNPSIILEEISFFNVKAFNQCVNENKLMIVIPEWKNIHPILKIIPVFIGNFYLVLFSRAALGFGIGLFNSLLIGLISYFFDGNERTTLIGYHEALGGLGGMLITYIAGQLMHVNWQAPFISYAIAIPVFFIFWKVIPKVKTEDILHKNTKQVVVNDGKEGNFSIVFVFMILIVIGATLNMTMGIKVSSLIVEQGYGSAVMQVTVIMLLSLGAMISGFLFGKMYKLFKNYIMSVGFTITALAMFIIGISNTSWMTVLGGFLVGFGFRVMMPCLTNIVNSSHLKNPTLATSLLLVAYNLGSAFAPYGSMIILKFSWTSDLRGIFYVDGIGFICLAVIVLL